MSFKHLEKALQNYDVGLMNRTETSRTILLINDETSVRELLQICLGDLAGWDVVTASSAQEGLRKLAIKLPDAILFDVLTPGMDATTFIRRLQNSPLTAVVPVILLSEPTRWFTRSKLRRMGVLGAIAQPFDPITLPKKIACTLGWPLHPQESKPVSY